MLLKVILQISHNKNTGTEKLLKIVAEKNFSILSIFQMCHIAILLECSRCLVKELSVLSPQ